MSEHEVQRMLPTSGSLWPRALSLAEHWDSSDGGHLPDLDGGERTVWSLIDPDDPRCFRTQLSELLEEIGSSHPDSLDSTVSIDESGGPVHIDAGAFIDPSTRFEGPCYVAPEAEVRHGALVRAHTWVCYQAVVGHASEVKHTLLLPNAKAPHFNYVGDSILGSHCNLGAGCKLSNLRNDGMEVVVKAEGVALESGLRKFGALVGDRVQIGCNTVTNPGVILAPDCMVRPNSTVFGVHAVPGSDIR